MLTSFLALSYKMLSSVAQVLDSVGSRKRVVAEMRLPDKIQNAQLKTEFKVPKDFFGVSISQVLHGTYLYQKKPLLIQNSVLTRHLFPPPLNLATLGRGKKSHRVIQAVSQCFSSKTYQMFLRWTFNLQKENITN